MGLCNCEFHINYNNVPATRYLSHFRRKMLWTSYAASIGLVFAVTKELSFWYLRWIEFDTNIYAMNSYSGLVTYHYLKYTLRYKFEIRK